MQRAAQIELAGQQEWIEAEHRVETGRHLRIQPDALAAPDNGHMQAGGDGKTGHRRQSVGNLRVSEALARQHQVARAFEHLENFRVNRVHVAPQVQVPVFAFVEVEEGLDRDADFQQRLDIELHRDADGQRAASHVEVDHRQESALCGALELGQHRQQLGLHHQQQPWAGQLEQYHALQVEDDARSHGADDRADAECPGVDLGLPGHEIHRVAVGHVLQPCQGWRHRRCCGFLAPVMHREQAEETVNPQARVGQRNRHWKFDFQRDDHAGRLAPTLVDVGDANAGSNPHLDRNDGQVDLALDLVLVEFHVAPAAQRPGNIHAGGKGGEFGRAQRIELHANPRPLDGDHTEIDGKAQVDLEDQRVVARDARAQDRQNAVERRRHADRARLGHVDGVALGCVEHRTELELRLVRVVADADADRLVAHRQRRAGLDFDQLLTAYGNVQVQRGFHVEQDHRFNT
ncbi:hypothetical protein PS639_06460 [Pseudomonas fluorescens]|nr:hypothetical protein PS639_06460 [Pseudomonas fluorescens]